MIEDRDYMREPEEYAPRRFGVRWSSLTVKFLIAYVVVFLLELLFAADLSTDGKPLFMANSPEHGRWFYNYFALSNEGLTHGYVWQFVTYQFMHAGFLHLLFNGWAIYSFGLALESQLGAKRFGVLMLSSGIIGGVWQSVAAFLWPHYFGGPVVGASACAFGLVAAFAVLQPNLKLQLLVFFVIPVTLSARNLLIVSFVIALIGFGMHSDNVAHAAHLGGMAAGWFYARIVLPRMGRKVSYDEVEPQSESAADSSFTASEVDAILDKINAAGGNVKVLTAKERAILESASKKKSRP